MNSANWEQIYGENKLKPGWTHIFADLVQNVIKSECIFSFKTYKLRNLTSFSLSIHAYCRECKRKLLLQCLSIDSLEFHLILEGQRKHKHKGTKRFLTGTLRAAVAEQLKSKSAEKWRRDFISKNMKFGDDEPYNLYSGEVLRKAKQEEGLKQAMCIANIKLSRDVIQNVLALKEDSNLVDFIRLFSIDPFIIHYWSNEQILLYKQYVRSLGNSMAVSIDATGSLIKKTGISEKHIFLYSIVVNHNQMPVGQMISAAHSTHFLTFWLLQWSKDFAIPKTVVCDHSYALLNSISLAFNNVNLTHYLNKSFEIVQKNERSNFPCFLRIDYNHFMHSISRWSCFKSARKLQKEFYIRAMNWLIECTDFSKFGPFLESVLIISLSEYESPDIRERKKILKEYISTGREVPNTDSVEIEEEPTQGNEATLSQLWYDNLGKKIVSKLCSMGEEENYYFFPELKCFIRHCLRTLPLWSGIMVSIYNYGEKTASSAQVESYFKDVKHVSLENYNLPINVDKYLITMWNDLKAKSIIANIKVEQKEPKISSSSPKAQHVEEENWKNKNKVKKGYYKHPIPAKSLFLMNNGSLSTKVIILDSKKFLFKNTCAFDSFLQLLAAGATDSVLFAKTLKTVEVSELLSPIVDKLINVSQSNELDKLRAIALKFGYVSQTPINNVHIVSCECNICHVIDKYLKDVLSLNEECDCGTFNVTSKYLSININIIRKDGYRNLNAAIEDCYIRRPCFRCNKAKNVDLNCPGIAIIDTNGCPPDVIFSEIPQNITIFNETFQLRGAISYQSSPTEIGHYFAVALRSLGTVEVYDDMSRIVKIVKDLSVTPHLLVYSK